MTEDQKKLMQALAAIGIYKMEEKLKWVAFGLLVWQLYMIYRKNGNTLAQNPEGWQATIDPGKIIDTLAPNFSGPKREMAELLLKRAEQRFLYR